jgi:hypothetical protein
MVAVIVHDHLSASEEELRGQEHIFQVCDKSAQVVRGVNL